MDARILFVEDNEDDVELMLRRLREGGIEPLWARVQDEAGLRRALQEDDWQVALVDYNLPGYSGLEALRLIAGEAPDVQAITVSGSIDEETAVASISAGAVDYILKDNLTRLVPAVRRAVETSGLLRSHRQTAAAARLALHAIGHASLAVFVVRPNGVVLYANDEACRVVGRPRDGIVGERFWSLVPGLDEERARALLAQAASERHVELRYVFGCGEGRARIFDVTAEAVPGEEALVVWGRDVTERVRTREELERTVRDLADTAARLHRTLDGAVNALSRVVETRDPYTAGHQRRVAQLATAMAAHLGYGGEELEGVRMAGLLHDLGKLTVPAEILAKPGRLTEVEFNLIRQHPAAGYEIVRTIEFTRPVAEMVWQHHERCDGSGYPRGLRGEQVLPEARLLAVADVVEAMSSHRPYREALGLEAALAEIRAGAGTRYDVEAAAACEAVMAAGFTFAD